MALVRPHSSKRTGKVSVNITPALHERARVPVRDVQGGLFAAAVSYTNVLVLLPDADAPATTRARCESRAAPSPRDATRWTPRRARRTRRAAVESRGGSERWRRRSRRASRRRAARPRRTGRRERRHRDDERLCARRSVARGGAGRRPSRGESKPVLRNRPELNIPRRVRATHLRERQTAHRRGLCEKQREAVTLFYPKLSKHGRGVAKNVKKRDFRTMIPSRLASVFEASTPSSGRARNGRCA